MKEIKNLIIIGLVVVIVILTTCNKPQTVTETKTVTRVDSVRITDTIVQEVSKYIPSVKYDTVTRFLTDDNYYLNTYYYRQTDSLLDATILIHAEERPDSVGLKYDLKQFTIHDSIYIRDSVHTTSTKSFLSIGALAYGNQETFGFAPSLNYNHRSGNTYGAAYDPINKYFLISFHKKLSFRK